MAIKLQLISDRRRTRYLQERIEQFADRCREAGLSVTPQRRAIIGALLETEAHPRAEDIYETVREKHPNISLATVHRTLETLCRIGEARKVTQLHSSARYDGNVEPHHHLICVSCRKVIDVEAPELDDLLAGKRKFGDHQLLGCSVEIHILCKDCRQEQRGEDNG